MADKEPNPDTNFEPDLSGSKFRAITSAEANSESESAADSDLQPSQSSESGSELGPELEAQSEPDPHTMTVVEHLD